MDGTIRDNIKQGTKVRVVQKQDQRSGKLTEGVVLKILTNSATHHHGILLHCYRALKNKLERTRC